MSNIDEEIKVKITAPVARTFVWLLTFIGFILGAVALRSCNFMEVHDDTSTLATTPTYFGLYRQENMLSNVCILYPSNSLWSASHKAAGAMGIIACILSGIVWVTMLCMTFIKTHKLCWNMLSIMLSIAFITESLQFIFFNDPACTTTTSDVQCRLGSGGATAVASMIFLLLASICMCCMKAPTKPAFILDLSDVTRDDSNSNNKTSTNFMGIIISKTKITNKKSPNDIEEAGQGKGLTPAVVPASNLPQSNQQQPQRMEQNIAPAVLAAAATTTSRGGPSAFDLTNLPTTDTADTGIPSNHQELPPAVAFVPNEVDL